MFLILQKEKKKKKILQRLTLDGMILKLFMFEVLAELLCSNWVEN